MYWLIFLLVVAITIILLLIVKIIIYRKNLNAIKNAYQTIIKSDTNGEITISTRNKEFKALVNELNRSLRELKELRIEYNNGNTELKKIIVNLSHDLRTPITAIIGYLNLLEEKNIQFKELEVIQKRMNELKDLTEDLFRYTLLVDVHNENESLNVIDCLKEALLSFYGALSMAKIETSVNILEEEITIKSNRETLNRIFNNIFSNILKYAEKNLNILVKDSEIIISNYTTKVDNLKIGKIFDRYFTVSTNEYATGLGLDIARSLVEAIGGKITASLKNNIFTLTLSF